MNRTYIHVVYFVFCMFLLRYSLEIFRQYVLQYKSFTKKNQIIGSLGFLFMMTVSKLSRHPSYSLSRPQGYITFSCSTQLKLKFKLLIKCQMEIPGLNHQRESFILLINVKMPTIVGILTFMSRINFMLS